DAGRELEARGPLNPADLRDHVGEVRVEREVHVAAQPFRRVQRAAYVRVNVGEGPRAAARANNPRPFEFQLFMTRGLEDRGDELPIGALAKVRADATAAGETALAAFRDERERAEARAGDEALERRRFAGLLC